jgi:ABC-type uncharacterized transport system involved in gliding motility auxiliary subunit
MSEQKTRVTFATNLGRMAGAIGVVLAVSTLVTLFLTEEIGFYIWGKLIVGGLCIGFYLFTNADFFTRMAGARSTGMWAITIASAVIVIGVVGVLNYVVIENDREIDVTREGLHTLSDQTRKVLSGLDREVKVLAFYESWEPAYLAAEEMLGRYARVNERLTFEMVSPQERPDLIERHGITERGARIVVLSGANEARARDASESELTNAVVRVAARTAKTIAFVTGHGEPGIDDAEAAGYKALAELVRAEGYEVRTLSMLKAATAGQSSGKIEIRDADTPENERPVDPPADAPTLEIPTDTAVLVVAGSASLLYEPELAAIEAFLARGGRVIVAVDANVEPGVLFLDEWNVEVRDDFVVDANVMNRLLGLGPAAPMVYAADHSDQEEVHPVIKDLTEPGVMFTARTLGLGGAGGASVQAMPLLITDESAWGETHPVDGAAERGEDDNLGPVVLGMVATRHVPSHNAERLTDEARLVVFGDSDWLNNRYLPLQGNADLAVNTINWLAAEEDKIAIGRKARSASMVFFSLAQLTVLKFVSLDLLWILYVAVGLGVVLVRRQK